MCEAFRTKLFHCVPPESNFESVQMSETQSFVDRLESNGLFLEAVAQSSVPFRQKLMLRLAYRVPSIRADIDAYVQAAVDESGDPGVLANGDIIRIIIEHLPEIIAFIEMLLKLFGGV